MARPAVKGGKWHRPAPGPVAAADASARTDAVIDALSRALGASQSHGAGFSVARQRLAGRSNMFVVSSETPVGGHRRWVVKQPRTEWSQDDVDSPLSAGEEFAALQRLSAHFAPLDVALRVPAPVAYLPELDAFAMEYVDGETIKDRLSPRVSPRPSSLLGALTAAGDFLRHLHALEALPPIEVDLREEASKVLSVAEEKLHPLGLSLPDQVRRTMVDFPALTVTSPQVRLHGDFGPSNILLAGDGSTVGIDAALSTVGAPEDDLVRFVALVSGAIRFAPGLVASPVVRGRQHLEERLLQTYYQAPARPLLFELRYLHQLARRWCRLRELAEQHGQKAVLSTRLRVIGAQVRQLMSESERRLVDCVGDR